MQCNAMHLQGVEFQSPHDGSTMMLTPEKSMKEQNQVHWRHCGVWFSRPAFRVKCAREVGV